MNATALAIDLRRLLRTPAVPIFVLGLPTLLYVIFGGSAEYSDAPMGLGNVSMVMMINMAAYGAITATTSISSTAATEKIQGWGRQLALSGQSDWQYLLSKIVLSFIMAAVPTTMIYLVGYLMGAEGPVKGWVISYLCVVIGSAIFSLYGLVIGQLIRSDVAVSVATGLVVLLAFAGGLFTPLNETLYQIGEFTPLFGLGVISRWAVTEGEWIRPSGEIFQENLTHGIINAVAWIVIFLALSLWTVKRSRAR